MNHMMNVGDSGQEQPQANKTVPSPALPVAGGAIGAAWRIAIKNLSLTLAVFLIQLPLTLVLSQLPPDRADKDSAKYTLWYEWLISGFVTFGIYRCVLAAARHGQPISLGRIYSEGGPFWGRNFRLSWLRFVSQYGLILVSFIPSALMVWLVEARLGFDGLLGVCLIALSVLAGAICFVFAALLAIRMALSTAWLADDEHGRRTSAIRALGESLAMTKKRDLRSLHAVLWMSVLAYGLWFLVRYGAYFVLGDGSELFITYGTSAWISIMLSLPESFISVWVSCMFAMLYLQYSEPVSDPAKQSQCAAGPTS